MGVVILAEEQETILSLTNKLLEAVSLRVDVDHQYEAIYQGLVLNPDEAVITTNLKPLQRLDLKRDHDVPKGGSDPLNLLDGLGLHVSQAHFGSHGFGQVTLNLGILIEHNRANRSTVRKASQFAPCFLVRGFDDRE